MTLRTGLVALALALAGPAAASPEAPRAVVELFTSQGCSSCPPADRILAELAREPDVVALTLPVDYWDYLGWRDTLAQAEFSARQRAYAGARGDRMVYTPQAVINGVVACVGSDRGQVEQAIERSRDDQAALPVAIAITESGPVVAVEVGAGAGAAAEVWLMPVARAREVAIGRGENRGRSITYANVVRGMTRLGPWSGAPARFEVPLATARAGADSYVVLLQATAPDGSGPGPILGAAKAPGL